MDLVAGSPPLERGAIRHIDPALLLASSASPIIGLFAIYSATDEVLSAVKRTPAAS